MKRLLLLTVVSLASAIATAAPVAAPVAKPVILKPGKSHEKCMVLDSHQKLEYQFEASAKINFNLHYDKGDSMYYPVKLDRTKGESGMYEAKSREKYCLAWENRSDADVELNFTFRTEK